MEIIQLISAIFDLRVSGQVTVEFNIVLPVIISVVLSIAIYRRKRVGGRRTKEKTALTDKKRLSAKKLRENKAAHPQIHSNDKP